MKTIKEGLINEEIVRRYPGSDNGGNYVIDKGNQILSAQIVSGARVISFLNDQLFGITVNFQSNAVNINAL